MSVSSSAFSSQPSSGSCIYINHVADGREPSGRFHGAKRAGLARRRNSKFEESLGPLAQIPPFPGRACGDRGKRKSPQSLTSKTPQAFLDDDKGDPYGTRTRVAAVKGRCPRPLDEGASCEQSG